MKFDPEAHSPVLPKFAWSCAALVGAIGPAIALIAISYVSSITTTASSAPSIIAVGLMGAGMITASASGRFWLGFAAATIIGIGFSLFIAFASETELQSLVLAGLAIVMASVSFAARGALFARSGQDKGWLIALFVVAGEAAILISASVDPELWPNWLLALLPAQWTNIAIQAATLECSRHSYMAAVSALTALGMTALATMFVVWLWPRRWTYIVMFSTWLGMSALVYQYAYL